MLTIPTTTTSTTMNQNNNNNMTTTNDDPSPSDLSQWIQTGQALKPNFEFYYPNTWQLDCGALKLVSPTEISPWRDATDGDSCQDHIRVDFTLGKLSESILNSMTTPGENISFSEYNKVLQDDHEFIHRETFQKLSSSAVSDYSELQVLTDCNDWIERFTRASGNKMSVRKSLLEYLSYGRIQTTRHHLVTVSIHEKDHSLCTFVFSYLTETQHDRNLRVFEKFLENFVFPSVNELIQYNLTWKTTNHLGQSVVQKESCLFTIPFPYQFVQKREGQLQVYTPAHMRVSNSVEQSNMISSNIKQLYFDFQVVKSNQTPEKVAHDYVKRVTSIDYHHTSSTSLTLNSSTQFQSGALLSPESASLNPDVKIIQPVHPVDSLPNAYSFTYQHGGTEEIPLLRNIAKFIVPLDDGTNVVSTYVNSMFSEPDVDMEVYKNILKSLKLIDGKQRSDLSGKIVNNQQSAALEQQVSEFNIAVYGSDAVGKSSLIDFYLHGERDFDSSAHNPTPHEASFRKYVPKSDSHSAFVLNILDTAGLFENESVSQFEKATRADAVILVCSGDCAASVDNLETIIYRIERLKKRSVSEIPSLLVFNKTDIEEPLIKSEQAKTLADRHGITFIESSLKKMSKVIDVFEGALIAELYSKQYILNNIAADQKKLAEDVENFQYLIIQNQIEQITSMLAEGTAPCLASEYMNVPIIFYAAENGVEPNIMKLLIEQNAQHEKFNLKNFVTNDFNSMNLGLFAACKGNLEVLKLLEAEGVTIEQQQNTDINILAHVLQSLFNETEGETAAYLLEKYEHLLSKYVNSVYREEDNTVSYPIHIAAKAGSLSAVKWLLDHGAKETLNQKDTFGVTTLLFAVAEGNTALLELLLESGANLEKSEVVFQDFLKQNCPAEKSHAVTSMLSKYGVKVNKC